MTHSRLVAKWRREQELRNYLAAEDDTPLSDASKLQQIDAIHQPTRSIRFGYPCTTCTECLAIYPCPTARILQGDNQ